MRLHFNSYISTEESFDFKFFDQYMLKDKWVEANELYGSRITEITNNVGFSKHYIQHISNYDMALKKFVITIFRHFKIKPKDFRCDFFLTKAGGSLPEHIDSQSLVAILIPLGKNTGDLVIQDSPVRQLKVCYQNMLVLNTQKPHSVQPPTSDRLMFRIGVHDTKFDVLLENLGLK